MQMLDEDALDVGLARTPLSRPSKATLMPLERDRFVVALPREHPLARRSSLRLAHLAEQPFVMYTGGGCAGSRDDGALPVCRPSSDRGPTGEPVAHTARIGG
jgi:DNA-binding transcriptional LysR family regulator